jgi:hypothetical protein
MPSLRAVLMPSKRFFICTRACEECCEKIVQMEKFLAIARGVKLCVHEDRELLRLWIAHESVDDG